MKTVQQSQIIKKISLHALCDGWTPFTLVVLTAHLHLLLLSPSFHSVFIQIIASLSYRRSKVIQIGWLGSVGVVGCLLRGAGWLNELIEAIKLTKLIKLIELMEQMELIELMEIIKLMKLIDLIKFSKMLELIKMIELMELIERTKFIEFIELLELMNLIEHVKLIKRIDLVDLIELSGYSEFSSNPHLVVFKSSDFSNISADVAAVKPCLPLALRPASP